MDQIAPLEDDVPNGALIDAGATLANRLMFQLRGRLAHPPAPGFGLAFLRHIFRHFLRPAEAALRRAIYLLADTLAPEPARKVSKPGHPGEAGSPDPQSKAPRTPTFRLTEAPPRTPPSAVPLNRRPRISIAGLAPQPAPRRAPDPVALEDRLHRRLAAFDAAFHNPVRAARRLLRLLSRRVSKRPCLAFTTIPGLDAKPLAAPDRETLTRLNAAVSLALGQGADTS